VSLSNQTSPRLSRRDFLRLGLLGLGGLALSGCQGEWVERPPLTPTPNPTATPRLGPQAIVEDVLDYRLTSEAWPGDFGWVTFRLHEALYEGESVYYICTDASDEAFARENGLVWAPLLIGAREEPGANRIYVFPDGRPPVMASIPGQPQFLSLFERFAVLGADESLRLASARDVEAASQAGEVAIEASRVFVNCPVVRWPGGELPVDQLRDSYLGTGQLLAPPDIQERTVTFKLHEGYPGDRYIVTDTSAADRAPDMHIAAAPASWSLVERNAHDEVFVFANGMPGPGVFGHQPAVFGSRVDSLVWSPFWNHFTLEWVYESRARLLETPDEVYDALKRGELIQYHGVPDSHPQGFVVNCPIPILADNTFRV
jgi:hypothetical protein